MDRNTPEQQPGAPVAGQDGSPAVPHVDSAPIRLEGEIEPPCAAEAEPEESQPAADLPPPGSAPCRPWPRRGDRYYGYGGRGRGAW